MKNNNNYYLLQIPHNCKLTCEYYVPSEKDSNPAQLIRLTKEQYDSIKEQLTYDN